MRHAKQTTISCAEAQEMANLYIENKLPENRLPLFLKHIETCASCKEDLMVNYSILTAIEQLSNGEDFSESYVNEMESRLTNSKLSIVRGKKKIHRLRIVCLVLFLVCGFVIGLSSVKDPVRYYLPDGADSSLKLDYYGIPEEYDAVYQTLIEYNDRVIEKLNQKSTK